jgi:hypothetical protein
MIKFFMREWMKYNLATAAPLYILAVLLACQKVLCFPMTTMCGSKDLSMYASLKNS